MLRRFACLVSSRARRHIHGDYILRGHSSHADYLLETERISDRTTEDNSQICEVHQQIRNSDHPRRVFSLNGVSVDLICMVRVEFSGQAVACILLGTVNCGAFSERSKVRLRYLAPGYVHLPRT